MDGKNLESDNRMHQSFGWLQNCYAETLSNRLHAMGVKGYKNKFSLTIHNDRLDMPKKIKKPTLFFVNSMSDMFHPKIPFEFIDKVIKVIKETPQHNYQY